MTIRRFQLPGRAPSKLYSPLVEYGNLLFVTGQVARTKEGEIVGRGDFVKQADQVFANIAEVLAAGGATLADLLKVTVFVTDARYRDEFRIVTEKYLGQHLPASTLVVVAALADPAFLIDIEGIAARRSA
jgi:enamine deaminase RidA (YjgF/YER057c/UK114 family)